MSYLRVVPRDLFNEADLLKCLGHLWIKLDDDRRHQAGLSEGAGQPFEIEQDPSDGSISVVNLAFGIGGRTCQLFRPLNSRQPWSLWARAGDDDVRVFDEDGELSPEFWILITEGIPK